MYARRKQYMRHTMILLIKNVVSMYDKHDLIPNCELNEHILHFNKYS